MGLGFGGWGVGCKVWGLGFGVWGLWFGVVGLGFWAGGLGFGLTVEPERALATRTAPIAKSQPTPSRINVVTPSILTPCAAGARLLCGRLSAASV